jgi:hypothetical protein
LAISGDNRKSVLQTLGVIPDRDQRLFNKDARGLRWIDAFLRY